MCVPIKRALDASERPLVPPPWDQSEQTAAAPVALESAGTDGQAAERHRARAMALGAELSRAMSGVTRGPLCPWRRGAAIAIVVSSELEYSA